MSVERLLKEESKVASQFAHTSPKVCTCTLPVIDFKALDQCKYRLEGVSTTTGSVQVHTSGEGLRTWMLPNRPVQSQVAHLVYRIKPDNELPFSILSFITV